jgi:hypothetical protein
LDGTPIPDRGFISLQSRDILRTYPKEVMTMLDKEIDKLMEQKITDPKIEEGHKAAQRRGGRGRRLVVSSQRSASLH